MNKNLSFDEFAEPPLKGGEPEFEIRLNGQNLSIASKVSLRLSEEESEAMKSEFSEFILKALHRRST